MEKMPLMDEPKLLEADMSVEKSAEQLADFGHRSFTFQTEHAAFGVLFKPQEELVPLQHFDGKSVVIVGETPYARDTSKVKEYFDSIGAHADFNSLQHTSERYGQKYHFGVSEFTESGRKEYVADTLVTQSPLKPQTDLMSFQIDALKEAGKDGKAEFIINSDVESILHAADLIEKTYPESRKGESLIGRSVPEIEDYIIAASFDDNGGLTDNMDESRKKVLAALLGDAEAADYLKGKLDQNKGKFEPLKIQRLRSSKESALKYMEYIREDMESSKRFLDEEIKTENSPSRLKELQRHIGVDEEKMENEQSRIGQMEAMIEMYREGRFEISEEDIAKLDKYVVVHMTDFYPVYDEEIQEWVVPTHSKATGDRVGRLSVHFSIDGIATAAGLTGGTGAWTQKPFAVVAPLGQMIKKNGLADGFMPSDAWWVVDPNEAGVKLPDSASIVAISQKGPGDIQHGLAHRSGREIDRATIGGEAKDFENFVKEKYGAELATLGNDTWHSNEKNSRSSSLFETMKKLDPFIWNGRHSDSPEQEFERSTIRFLDEGLRSDHGDASPEKAIEAKRKSRLDGQPRIAREFARQMVKTGIL